MSNANRNDAAFLADSAAARWSEVLGRCFCPSPINIDAVLASLNPLCFGIPGAVVFACNDHQQAIPPLPPIARPAIGVLLADHDGPIAGDKAKNLAARYAALAIEKECEVIILSHQHNAGFERFGFRVERVAGADADARAACIAQLKQFWDLEIII
ncbi:hypothetical protein ACEN2J_07580 [Pseudorhodobacter sp. W20_MBD10_FR17]|uniref:hypothetical protein n=1 Tax=Pseudorhodobacter sp. W20_MBD10_FR17 TaxID=3240266 RepID=UPI003F98760E